MQLAHAKAILGIFKSNDRSHLSFQLVVTGCCTLKLPPIISSTGSKVESAPPSCRFAPLPPDVLQYVELQIQSFVIHHWLSPFASRLTEDLRMWASYGRYNGLCKDILTSGLHGSLQVSQGTPIPSLRAARQAYLDRDHQAMQRLMDHAWDSWNAVGQAWTSASADLRARHLQPAPDDMAWSDAEPLRINYYTMFASLRKFASAHVNDQPDDADFTKTTKCGLFNYKFEDSKPVYQMITPFTVSSKAGELTRRTINTKQVKRAHVRLVADQEAGNLASKKKRQQPSGEAHRGTETRAELKQSTDQRSCRPLQQTALSRERNPQAGLQEGIGRWCSSGLMKQTESQPAMFGKRKDYRCALDTT